MPRLATIHLVPLRSSLVHLPISIYGPLVERSIRPQSLAVHLTLSTSGSSKGTGHAPVSAYVGWSGHPSSSSLAQYQSSTGSSGNVSGTVEMDPQYAQALGFAQGSVVEVGLVYDLPVATMVGAEPVGPDDWEIIVRHTNSILSTVD